MPPDIGIDISAAQSSVAPGPWLFIVHKATEGHDYRDPQFAGRYRTLNPGGLRGAYHYARPGDGFNGTQQADFFADVAIAAGFVPGIDLWQLDCEGIGNESVSDAVWAAFVPAFMAQATKRLGVRGFLYVGAYFHPAAFAPLAGSAYAWWLPDYGPNDGACHAISKAGANPVIHQFSSAGSLDRNVIADVERWQTMVVPPSTPAARKVLAALAALNTLLKSVATRPVRRGDTGKRVLLVQQLLAKHGHATADKAGVFGSSTAQQVKAFKTQKRLKSRDGNVVGRACVRALLSK